MQKIKVGVVGLSLGDWHCSTLAQLEEYDLIAVCDINQSLLSSIAEKYNIPNTYSDYEKFLENQEIEAVWICTPTNLHRDMVLLALQKGIRYIYCEKPIAVCMGDALKIAIACKKAGAEIIFGHQRRMSNPYLTMKKVIDDGKIGEIQVIRGSSPGDVLSDGSHMIDSMLFLTGDIPVQSVLGQVFWTPLDSSKEIIENPFAYCGTRYGHFIERGCIADIELINGVRLELKMGDAKLPNSGYQQIEIIGTKGRILRPGDFLDIDLMMESNGKYEPYPVEHYPNGEDELFTVHRAFAKTIFQGEKHPMGMENALPGFEILMAIFESARLHQKLSLPINQMQYPLELMMKQI